MTNPALPPAPKLPVSLAANPVLSSWIRLSPEGQVVVSPGKVEIGQGIVTALAQIAADELDVDIGRVRMLRASTAASPNEGVTSGSLSVQQSGRAIRQVCAEVRQIFLKLASDRLRSPWPTVVACSTSAVSIPGKLAESNELSCAPPELGSGFVSSRTTGIPATFPLTAVACPL